jgi:hypothetical protein
MGAKERKKLTTKQKRETIFIEDERNAFVIFLLSNFVVFYSMKHKREME